MSTATHTIDTPRLTPPASAARTSPIRQDTQVGVDQDPYAALHLADRVMAITVSIGLGAVLCVSQAGQWATMMPSNACVRPHGLLVRRVLPGRRGAARGARRADGDGRVRDRDVPVHLHRHARPTPGTGRQGCRHRGVRLPGGTAGRRGQLRGRSADLRRQAPPGVLRSPGVLQALVFAALAVSLVAIIGVGLGGLIRHTAGATTTLVLVIVGGAVLGQFLPAGLRQYLPGTALEAAVTVHRSAGSAGSRYRDRRALPLRRRRPHGGIDAGGTR